MLWIFNSFLDSFKSMLKKIEKENIYWETIDEAIRWCKLLGVRESHEIVQTCPLQTHTI